MSNFGITPSGYVPKLVDDAESDIDTSIRSTVDPNMDMSAAQPLGQMKSTIATEVALLWELGAVCYSGLNPNNAEGMILDGDCAYTGTLRDKPQYSTVVGTMTLNATTTVAAGSVANVSGQPTNQWQLLGPADPTTGLLIAAGPVVSTTSGPYLGLFQATVTGPQLVNAGQLTVIATPVSGWTAVTNVNGCILGTNVESDSLLNVRREEEFASAGNDTPDATEAALLSIVTSSGAKAVTNAFVFENDTEVTATGTVPANCPAGVPPHNMYVVVYDGLTPLATNAQIAQAIWNNKPSGTGTYGSLSGVAIDSQGSQHTINFDRATIVPVYVSLTTTRGPSFDPVNGPAAIGAALVAYWTTQRNLGVSMIIRFIGGSINNGDIKGLIDVPAFNLGTSYGSIANVNIPATGLQVLTLNTGLDGSSHPYITVDGVGV